MSNDEFFELVLLLFILVVCSSWDLKVRSERAESVEAKPERDQNKSFEIRGKNSTFLKWCETVGTHVEKYGACFYRGSSSGK